MTISPHASAEPGAEIACPFCASTETELFAMFSHFLLASQYYCRGCKTVFDAVRWQEPARATSAEEGETHPPGVRSSNRGASRGEAD